MTRRRTFGDIDAQGIVIVFYRIDSGVVLIVHPDRKLFERITEDDDGVHLLRDVINLVGHGCGLSWVVALAGGKCATLGCNRARRIYRGQVGGIVRVVGETEQGILEAHSLGCLRTTA